MKYVEPIKSFILLFLVLLSLLFTFMIWNYKPNYPLQEPTQKERNLTDEKKILREVVKPYRLLFSSEAGFKGSDSTEKIDTIMGYLNSLEIRSFSLIDAPISTKEINEMVRTQSHMTMFFQTEIPIQVFGEMLSLDDTRYNEASFNRLIMNWSTVGQNRLVHLYFISTSGKSGYQAEFMVPDIEIFNQIFVEKPKSFFDYMEVERPNNLSLYIAEEPVKLVEYTYVKDEFSADTLKNILFEDTTIVEKTSEGVQEKYTDDMSLMTLDTSMKAMNYVYPPTESSAAIPPYRLLEDTFDFINQHGGFTGDYRLTYMNTERHIAEYQMYWEGYPVYGSTGILTRLITTWGDEQIFRYRRPYYLFDSAIFQDDKVLEAGRKLVDEIHSDHELNFSSIDDIVVGYYLTEDPEKPLYRLEPSWFVLMGNIWVPLLPERGGDEYGLE